MTDGQQRVRMAQYGTKHAHAPGVLAVMLANPDVELVGSTSPTRRGDGSWRRRGSIHGLRCGG